MKKYESPKADVVLLANEDVIRTSEGVNSPIVGEGNGSWSDAHELNH